MTLPFSRQAQQALVWGLLRVFWCYGGERYWNFCGHMIKDRAHPLANFIQAYNQRRAVDNIPPAWIDEVLTYSATNKLTMAKDAVEHLRVEAPEPEYDVRQLLLKSTPTDAPELRADPALLQFVLPQLHGDWAHGNFTPRATLSLTSRHCVVSVSSL